MTEKLILGAVMLACGAIVGSVSVAALPPEPRPASPAPAYVERRLVITLKQDVNGKPQRFVCTQETR